ncbi:MAG: MCE family protein, partial [Thermoguttaceae bacterium]|nr:MCE family protein [Thermoguttaceae bacterium]
VIGIVAGVFIMTILFGSNKGFFVGGGGKRLTIVFEKAGGVTQNSLVLKNGIKIGRVYSVDLLDDKEQAQVKVTFELNPGAKIYTNEYAKINRTFLGDASIEFVKNPEFKGEIGEVDGTREIRGKNGGDVMSAFSNIEGDLAQALQNINGVTENINDIAQEITRFMASANDFIGDKEEVSRKKAKVEAIFTEVKNALATINSLGTNINAIVSDERLNADIRRAASEVPQILERVDSLMESANALAGDARKTMARAETTFDLVDKNLDNVDRFTTSLSEQGPEIMASLNEGAAEIRSMMLNVASLARELETQFEDPSTPLGMLADQETAARLRRIVRNAEELTEKVYPILDDARVFSNKIAHRPSSLIWDKNTFKGAPTSGRYGMQADSPNGGLSSPLYRPTPSGQKICARAQYYPAADLETMDAETRLAYESAYPETKKRGRWSPTTLWNKICAKNASEDGGAFWAFGRSKSKANSAWETRSVGYVVPSGTFAPVGAAVYSGSEGTPLEPFETEVWENGAEYGEFDGGNVATGASTDGAFATPKTISTEESATISSVSRSAFPSSTVDAKPLGPYAEAGADALELDFGLADDSAENGDVAGAVEELPTSINRIAEPSLLDAPKPIPNGAGPGTVAEPLFEDDGLPLQFAPPTRR